MATIICPACGRSVSGDSLYCPHCGKYLRENSTVTYQVIDDDEELTNVEEGTPVISGYDVMVVDYITTEYVAQNALIAVLECTRREAQSILASLPAYLYTDIEKDAAVYIAEKLRVNGVFVALYDPDGECTYYTPNSFTTPVPTDLNNVSKDPWMSVLPTLFLVNALRPRRVTYTVNPFNPMNNLFSPFRMNVSTPRRQSAPRNSVPGRGMKPGSSRGPFKR